MKKTFAILLASTALAFGAGIPAWSAMNRVEHSSKSSQDDRFVGLASDDDDDRDHGRSDRSNDDGHRDGDDDDDDEDDGDDDDDEGADDDDGSRGAASASPAPAGTVAPPANGLFGSGAMPKVKVN